MNSRFNSRFNSYKCSRCKKLTRDTGHGEAQAEVCRKCFDIYILENEHEDGEHDGNPNSNCPMCQ